MAIESHYLDVLSGEIEKYLYNIDVLSGEIEKYLYNGFYTDFSLFRQIKRQDTVIEL
jgi:hypothetical protein